MSRASYVPGKEDESRERRKVSIHAENTIRHDQPAACASCRSEQRFQMIRVAVAIHTGSRPAQTAPVYDACVVQFVAQDHVAGLDHGRKDRRCWRHTRN